MKRFLPSLFFALALWACAPGSDSGKSQQQTKTVTGEHFTVEVPKITRENSRLNQDAALCYTHLGNGVSVMVIEETKSDFADVLIEHELDDLYQNDLGGYNSLVLDGFGGETGLAIEGDIHTDTTSVGSLPCIANHFLLPAEHVTFAYDLLCIEGKDNYYQFIFFCQDKDTKKYAGLREAVLSSFRENE